MSEPVSERTADADAKAVRDFIVIAYQHPRYQTGGESKRDHAVTEKELEKGSHGRTLCGRLLGGWYFLRTGQEWRGSWSFECAVCKRVAARLAEEPSR